MLVKFSDLENRKTWPTTLRYIEHALNNSVNRSTGYTPFQLLFGVEPRSPIPDKLKAVVTSDPNTSSELSQIRGEASNKLIKAQESQKHDYDRKRKQPKVYTSGDFVMVRNFDSTSGVSKKLLSQFKGPYEVTKVLRNNRYLISNIEGLQNIQRPYTGVWEASNMRPWMNLNYTTPA